MVTTYTIAFAALILTGGALGDRIGTKKIFMSGFAIFTAASLACAWAPSLTTLVIARSVQGAGAAILVPNSLALLNHTYSDEVSRSRAVGFLAAGASLALTAGPLIGGVLITLVGWRTIFLVNLPIGLAGLWLTWRHAEETTPSPHHELDLIGQVTAIGSLGCLVASIIEGGIVGWSHISVLVGLVTAAFLAVLFLLQERRAPQPMLPLGLFRHPILSLMTIIGVLVNVPFYGLIFVLSLYFQQIIDLSPLLTGLAFIPMMAAVLGANLIAAWVAQWFGALTTIVFSALIIAVGAIGLIGIDHDTNYWAMCTQLVAIGGGLGLLVPPLTSTLLSSVEKTRSGIAAGILNSARQTGSALGVALFESLISQTNAFILGVHESLVVAVVLMISAAIGAMIGIRVKCMRGS